MSNEVKVLVLAGYGLNCDNETAHAFSLAGAVPEKIHINALIDGSVDPSDFQIMAFGGGFSWGDDHGAGVVQAVRMKTNLGDKLLKFIDTGSLVIGICNGFQTLVNLGLLPGLDNDYQKRSVALTFNDCGNFRDDWVKLSVNSSSSCVFTNGIDTLDLPVRHGEGKFYADDTVLDRIEKDNQVVLRYADKNGMPANGRFPDNPNGSVNDIAGICDPTGRVFGLMPHPEAFNHWTNHPDWTRQKEISRRKGESVSGKQTDGNKIFTNAVNFVRAQ
ncbi:MAG: phosphoribosylformylglycinamidine synthase subunit PurQ [Desulfobacterales bacterium]|nr:phosphoribosylformylglycinamidine synthase subunit PurQ [Desulfobacterales bacterium]